MDAFDSTEGPAGAPPRGQNTDTHTQYTGWKCMIYVNTELAEQEHR